MSKPSLRVIRNETQQRGEIYLYGVIGDFWFEDNPLTARSFQQELTRLSDFAEIHVHINSPGGDVHEGLAICNAIRASKKNIHTYNDGICASMASVILASAGKDKRHAAKASLTMLHCASTFSWGNASQLRDDADMLEKHDDVLVEIIADALAKTPEYVREKFFTGAKDTWLTAKEAEAEGLVIVEDYATDDMPENPTAMQFNRVAAFYNKNYNQSDMSLIQFNNPFKGISALSKVAAKDVTEDQLKAVHDELEAQGIKGFTLVKTDDLNETVTNSEKVTTLEKKVNDLTESQTADQKTISDLQVEITNLKKELNKPAEDPITPVTDKTDKTPENKDKVVDNFETSYDREIKAAFGK